MYRNIYPEYMKEGDERVKLTCLPAARSKLAGVRIAVCGELPTACECLKKNGVVNIEKYSDAAELGLRLRGSPCDLILIYAPLGEGLINTNYSFRECLTHDWTTVPVRMLDEPACMSALDELMATVEELAYEKYVRAYL